MLYVLAGLHLKREALEEAKKVFTGEYLPLREKSGAKLVGAWQNTQNPTGSVDVFHLWAYADMNARQKSNETLHNDERAKKATEKMLSFMADKENVTYLEPMNYSPLK